MAETGGVTTLPRRRVVRPGHANAEELWQRYHALKTQRALWEFDWQDIVRYLVPGADDILTLRSVGESRTEFIYDSPPLLAPQTLAGNMMGAVTNSAIQWFRLRFRDEGLNESQQVQAWLQACDTRMLAAYNGSNFYQAAHTYYLNLGAFGTAAMYAASRRGSQGSHLHFKTLPTGSYCIAENAEGLVDTLFREMWLTPRQAYQLFEGQVSDQLRTQYENKTQCDTPRAFVHAVFPRADRTPRKRDNRNLPYAAVYFEVDTRFINEESGYEEFPFLVSRWETMSTAPWGFGPGHLALPDVRVLNTLRELHLQQLTLWVQPPLKALQEGVIGTISLESRAINVVRQMDALQTLDLTGRPDLVQIDQAELRRSIQDCFFVHALQALPPPDAGNMTAYEVSQRIEQMQRLMGPAFSRLLSEMLDPLADRVFGLMLRARALPQPPLDVLLAAQRNAGQLDVDYEGPLARSQRGADLRAIDDVLALGLRIGALAQQPHEVHDNIDWDVAYRHAAQISGAPRTLVRDLRAVQRLRQARAQQALQLQQTEQLQGNLAAMGRVAPLLQAVQDHEGRAA